MRAFKKNDDVDAFGEWSSRFHIELARMSGNSVLLKFLETIWDFLQYFIAHMSKMPESMEKSMKYHVEIFDAVISGDSDEAQDKMRQHLLDVVKRINRSMDYEIDAASLFGKQTNG